MDLKNAIEKYAEWKTKFRLVIKRRESMDSVTIAKDNCCELGKWLYGEGKLNFGHMTAHHECIANHAKFHVEAGKIASTINARDFKRAAGMLDIGTLYAAASSAVGISIMKLKKEIVG
ncbi:CZB domain-containing protein [Undibacterium sp. LX40W]|uniref:CZB domain-containing protein n=1 Tax=Undibacterium nitidum TaxID=2762298 RepID=A0A923HLY3_9BURK|nr:MULTISPECIES: CZB domain-containing protein [Undibacterium]MBC3880236.1 CZB domain-containing protein [Undibacterium nitidum]MBC3891028.1 CZB domain-containing protein [Undibacterium sp. LX40W]